MKEILLPLIEGNTLLKFTAAFAFAVGTSFTPLSPSFPISNITLQMRYLFLNLGLKELASPEKQILYPSRFRQDPDGTFKIGSFEENLFTT